MSMRKINAFHLSAVSTTKKASSLDEAFINFTYGGGAGIWTPDPSGMNRML